MDASYRSEFRELFDTNFARFDAKLEQRIAEVRAELAEFRGEMRAELAALESRLTMRMFLFWIGTAGIVLAEKLFS